MDYCAPLGIPHSVFMAWDDDDQSKALAWQRAQKEICTGCGTRMEDWDDDRQAFVTASDRCPGCELLAQEREQMETMETNPKGVRVGLIPRYLHEAREAERLQAEAEQ